jgi:hypothetical protein
VDFSVPFTNVGVILAAAARRRRSGIVAGCFDGYRQSMAKILQEKAGVSVDQSGTSGIASLHLAQPPLKEAALAFVAH